MRLQDETFSMQKENGVWTVTPYAAKSDQHLHQRSRWQRLIKMRPVALGENHQLFRRNCCNAPYQVWHPGKISKLQPFCGRCSAFVAHILTTMPHR